MKLYNTLTRRVEELKPVKHGQVSIYTCGPTVYDHVHIGNLRAYILHDLLKRVLKLSGYKVKAVMNVTDVDDKTIAKSQQEYPDQPAATALRRLTRHYEKLFLDDTALVGVDLSDTKLIRATDEISAMQELIRTIIRNGFGYQADGSVYFSIAKYTEAGHRYGRLSRVDYQPQARIDNDEYGKDSARDFALWKADKPGEPSWDFELEGHNLPGRPGWHIECSAMSAKYLGQPFDIHTGGIDLIFPHHEDELAQSEAAGGRPLANCFVHNNHLLVESKKMSKSLGNFYTLSDIIRHGHSTLAFRLLVLLGHYRSEHNFTGEALAGAENLLNNLYAWADRVFQPTGEANPELGRRLNQTAETFRQALEDDLNTPQAIAALSELVAWMEAGPLSSADIKIFEHALENFDAVLGLDLTDRADITPDQRELITQREEARAGKDFDSADRTRQKLAGQGIGLEDTAFGPRWRRTKPPAGGGSAESP